MGCGAATWRMLFWTRGRGLAASAERRSGMDAALEAHKRIGLVAHDHKKQDLVEWARYNLPLLARHTLIATGTTGRLLERELEVPIMRLQSGPLGGDLQLGAMIAD